MRGGEGDTEKYASGYVQTFRHVGWKKRGISRPRVTVGNTRMRRGRASGSVFLSLAVAEWVKHVHLDLS